MMDVKNLVRLEKFYLLKVNCSLSKKSTCKYFHNLNMHFQKPRVENPNCLFFKNGVLVRKWIPPNVPASKYWAVGYQLIITQEYSPDILKNPHEILMGGQLDVKKTCDKIIRDLFWSNIRQDDSQFRKIFIPLTWLNSLTRNSVLSEIKFYVSTNYLSALC